MFATNRMTQGCTGPWPCIGALRCAPFGGGWRWSIALVKEARSGQRFGPVCDDVVRSGWLSAATRLL